jgi:hypothetical protein
MALPLLLLLKNQANDRQTNSANLCSLWRVVYIIQLNGRDAFDPIWDNPTVMGLASFEMHIATVCAGLPVFWPVLKTTWNRIMVTYEVSVTRGYGVFPSKKAATDIELQAGQSDRNLVLDEQPDGWEPFVGDETTGLGENETVVESLSGRKWSTKAKEIFTSKPA